MNETPETPIIRLAFWLYLPMIATGVFTRSPGAFGILRPTQLALGMALALGTGAAVVLLSRWISRQTDWGRNLRSEFHALLRGMNSRQVLYLALLSGFGEEILFRGVLQPRLGWLWASLMFGALHFPFRPILIPWSLFALAMGFVLAAFTEVFQNLWPAILLHFMINYLNLHDLGENQEAPPGDP